jgi:hypothetical protein
MDVNAIYLNTDKAEEQKYVQEKAALNVKRAIVEAPQNWLDASIENPYRITDFTEVKTTWHPIGI